MAQDHHNEEDHSRKSRIRRLFKFLYEVNRLRNRPERTLREQVFVIPLTRLPEHPSIQLIRPVVTREDAQTSSRKISRQFQKIESAELEAPAPAPSSNVVRLPEERKPVG